jgi:alkylation response protein AidB-like acyl-CoA dehydrogenase
MDFTLREELRMLRDTVARFVKEELIPREPIVIRREAERGFTDSPLSIVPFILPPDSPNLWMLRETW